MLFTYIVFLSVNIHIIVSGIATKDFIQVVIDLSWKYLGLGLRWRCLVDITVLMHLHVEKGVVSMASVAFTTLIMMLTKPYTIDQGQDRDLNFESGAGLSEEPGFNSSGRPVDFVFGFQGRMLSRAGKEGIDGVLYNL